MEILNEGSSSKPQPRLGGIRCQGTLCFARPTNDQARGNKGCSNGQSCPACCAVAQRGGRPRCKISNHNSTSTPSTSHTQVSLFETRKLLLKMRLLPAASASEPKKLTFNSTASSLPTRCFLRFPSSVSHLFSICRTHVVGLRCQSPGDRERTASGPSSWN